MCSRNVYITCGCYIVTYSCVYCRQNILSLIMLCTSDIYALITYSTFVESFFILLSVSGILWLRYKKPDIPRPIKVSSLTSTDRLVHYIMVVRKCIWSSAKIALVHPVFQNKWLVVHWCNCKQWLAWPKMLFML